MGRRPIPAEQRAAIVASLTETPNAFQAARENRVCTDTAWKIAKAAGIELAQRGRPPMPVKKRKKIITSLARTRNATQAATQNGVNPATAQRIAKVEGLELAKKSTHVTEEKRAVIVASLTETSNAGQAARDSGTSVSTAWRIAKREGIKLGEWRRPISAEQRAAIITSLTETPNAGQVARKHGVDPKTARVIAKVEGIELPQRGRPLKTGAKAPMDLV